MHDPACVKVRDLEYKIHDRTQQRHGKQRSDSNRRAERIGTDEHDNKDSHMDSAN